MLAEDGHLSLEVGDGKLLLTVVAIRRRSKGTRPFAVKKHAKAKRSLKSFIFLPGCRAPKPGIRAAVDRVISMS